MVQTILVVEDTDNIRLIIRHNLRRAGFVVTEAADGLAGWEQLGREIPDLILLDLRMPRMSGFEFLEKLAHFPKAAHVPVVILSALSAYDDIDRALRLGALDYIIKPMDPTLLISKISGILAPASKGYTSGKDRREFMRSVVTGLRLDPSPGGIALDLSECGLSWVAHTALPIGRIIEVRAFSFLDRIGVKDDSLRARIVSRSPMPDRRLRVGGVFIGLSDDTRRVIRRFVLEKQSRRDGSELAEQAPGGRTIVLGR